MGKDQIDEQIKTCIEKFQKLSPLHQEWFYIAACKCDQEYEVMMQTVTKESERKWLAEIRETSAEAREKEQKKASVSPTKETTDAQNTAGTGRCGDYTTASRQTQGGI